MSVWYIAPLTVSIYVHLCVLMHEYECHCEGACGHVRSGLYCMLHCLKEVNPRQPVADENRWEWFTTFLLTTIASLETAWVCATKLGVLIQFICIHTLKKGRLCMAFTWCMMMQLEHLNPITTLYCHWHRTRGKYKCQYPGNMTLQILHKYYLQVNDPFLSVFSCGGKYEAPLQDYRGTS